MAGLLGRLISDDASPNMTYCIYGTAVSGVFYVANGHQDIINCLDDWSFF